LRTLGNRHLRGETPSLNTKGTEGHSVMDAVTAKQFLISRVIEEALSERVTLSDVEKKMLQYTELHPTLTDIHEANQEFERDYDFDEYEAKVIGLLQNARDGDRSTVQGQMWDDAIGALKDEDHYLLVMVHTAFPRYRQTLRPAHRIRDFILYIAIAVSLVAVVLIISILKN
jgi:hypothetical protein